MASIRSQNEVNRAGMNELNSLRAFVKVVEVGSFAEAARQMGTSKSVVTKRVNQLEEHLQLELLQRSTRRLSITDTGSALYERCVGVLAELDEAKSEVSSVEWGLSGTFRVSCISSFTVWQLRAAVLWGDCVAMMPAFFIEKELVAGELVPVLPKLRIKSANLSAYFRKTPFVPMKIRIFLNFLSQRYGDFPPWEQRLIAAKPELSGLLGPRKTEGN